MEKLTEQKYRELKDESEEAQRAADKAEGARDEMLTRLKEEFDCKSLEEGQKLLKKLSKEEAEKLAELTIEMETYEKKWKQDEE